MTTRERVAQTVPLSKRTQRLRREQKVKPMVARMLQRQSSLQFKKTEMLAWLLSKKAVELPLFVKKTLTL